MHSLRFHTRKLFMFMIIVLILALLVFSQLNHTSKQKINIMHNKLIHNYRAPSAKPGLRVDAPRLSHHNTDDRLQALRLNALFNNLTQEWSCPTCLGTELCEDISSGFLTLTGEVGQLDNSAFATHYPANIGVQHTVYVQVPNSSIYNRVQQVLCGEGATSGGGRICGVKAAAIRWPYITSSNTPLSPALLNKFLLAVQSPHFTSPLLTCPTQLSTSVLESSFISGPVTDSNSSPSAIDKLHLLTAIVAAPAFALQKMADQLQLSPAIVSMVGSCGRVWVRGREQITPLRQMLEEPWTVRAALGAQLLALVEDMLESSEEWLVYVRQWSVDSLAVTNEGELLLQDATHATIIDKSTLHMGASGEYGEEDDFDTLGETCNKECFGKLLSELQSRQAEFYPASAPADDHNSNEAPAADTNYEKINRDKTIYNHKVGSISSSNKASANLAVDHQPQDAADMHHRSMRSDSASATGAHSADSTCAHEDLFAHIMYVSACAFILSDNEAHRRIDFFTQLSGSPYSTKHYKGLLHSAPSDQQQLQQLLAGCVVERTPGDRLRTVEELKDFLSEHGGLRDDGGGEDDDDDYEDDEEDEDEEDYTDDKVDGRHAIGNRIKHFEGGNREGYYERDNSRGL